MTDICMGNAYDDCDRPAKYIRHTQFAGDHPLCELHAREDDQFLVNDSYSCWSVMLDEDAKWLFDSYPHNNIVTRGGVESQRIPQWDLQPEHLKKVFVDKVLTAKNLCRQAGYLDPDFVGDKGYPNWHDWTESSLQKLGDFVKTLKELVKE